MGLQMAEQQRIITFSGPAAGDEMPITIHSLIESLGVAPF